MSGGVRSNPVDRRLTRRQIEDYHQRVGLFIVINLLRCRLQFQYLLIEVTDCVLAFLSFLKLAQLLVYFEQLGSVVFYQTILNGYKYTTRIARDITATDRTQNAIAVQNLFQVQR